MATISPTRPVPTTSRSLLSAGLALATALGLGLAAGIATLYLQGLLPTPYYLLANSGAVWTLLAVATAAGCGGCRVTGAAAGTLALLGEVVGYYGWGAISGRALGAGYEIALWTAAALVLGPGAGLAGEAIRRGTVRSRLLALAAVAGVLIGEASYLLRFGIGGALARPELAAGVVLVVAASLQARVGVAWRGAAVAICAGVALSLHIAYAGG